MTYHDNNGDHTKKFTISGMWDGYGDEKVFYVSKSFFDESGFTLEDYGRGFLYLKFKSAIVTQKTQDNLEQSLRLDKKQRFLITADTATSVHIFLGLIGLIFVTCLSVYLLIYNILYLSVSGNVRYYGLLQTIGMTEKKVYRLVQKQMLFIGAIGIAVGMLAGVATSFGLIPAVVKMLGIREDYQQHPEKYSSFLVGIDEQQFQALNATLEQPVDEADFLSGNACILYTNWLRLDKTKTIGKPISFYLDGQDDQMFQMTIQGTTEDTYYANLLGTTPTMIVSDRFVRGIVEHPYVSKVSVQYQEEYDEATEKDIMGMMEASTYQKDFDYNSKIEAMKEVKEA